MKIPKRSSDINVLASQIVGEATKEPIKDSTTKPATDKNPAAVALGRLGGLKGGRARADKLSAKRRTQIAKKAAEFRWKK